MAMSELDIKLEGRVKVIVVGKILARSPNGAGGLPEMDILDDQGKAHKISAADLTNEEFGKIQPGAEIHVRIQENWIQMNVF